VIDAPELPLAGGAAVQPCPKRGPRCGRDVDAGPGSCWHYFDLCPEKVHGCYVREIRAIAERHGVQERQQITAAMQADIDAMHARRRQELQVRRAGA